MQLISTHIFTGLQQDTSVSKSNPLYLINAHNIRITAREGETLLSVTNEKGPRELTLQNTLGNPASITGTIIGHCVLNHYLVLFTHDGGFGDKIFRVDMSQENPELVSLYNPANGDSGFLGFSVDHPIEAIGDYESELILKVYWTDGINQPRVVNIIDPAATWGGAFDFTPELKLVETVTVEKQLNTSGIFPSGVIQYAFTYYNKYKLETNIFHVTPLNYISYFDRGASPEDKVSNSFKITITGYDKHFDYIRIYSIVRTSINATPVVKRVEDINIKSSTGPVTYIDTGTSGDIVDPTYLLYVGGEEVAAETLCSKDGTLFLGGIEVKRKAIDKDIKRAIENSTSRASSSSKTVNLLPVNTTSTYAYSSGLNTLSAGFKCNEYYRLGILFQYKNGKWSEPCYIGNFRTTVNPDFVVENELENICKLIKPIINYSIPESYTKNGSSANLKTALKTAGYVRMRALIAMPQQLDRTILAQGVLNPTLYTTQHRADGDLYALSSWFFRASAENTSASRGEERGRRPGSTTYSSMNSATVPFSEYDEELPYMAYGLSGFTNKVALSNSSSEGILPIEVQGYFDANNRFKIGKDIMTFHSPEVDLDDAMMNQDLSGIKGRVLGWAECSSTSSDMNIQTNTPTISNNGSGPVHLAGTSDGNKGLISGWFYDDFIVDESKDAKNFEKYSKQNYPVLWLVHPWQQSGSLNNDINRPADKGVRSAVLQKKVISNLRFFNTTWSSSVSLTQNVVSLAEGEIPQVFHSDLVSIVKIGSKIYQGNIDTMLLPDESDGSYFYGSPLDAIAGSGASRPHRSTRGIWKTWSRNPDLQDAQGLYKIQGSQWVHQDSNIGDYSIELSIKKEGVRLKYKSTPHIVLATNGITSLSRYSPSLHIVELYRDYNENTLYGGTSGDAKKANLWIPAGQAVSIDSGTITFEYGDTWYSRYDCLKTYPFTPEDANLIVEIGSFMLESHINGDGRYDRNRGLVNNLNMTPQNFNLINPVYSQLDNFFNYRILDSDFYSLNLFPNQVTWSTEKSAATEIDPWTSITLASTHDMDGSKGRILALKVWKDTIYCFQDNGISQILFNSRVQIPTSDNVPIEITNSYKVDGKRYISEGVGCLNKYSICESPSSLYFLDSMSKHLYSIGDSGMADVSIAKNMTSWFKTLKSSKWTASDFSTRIFHDGVHSELYVITERECLCYNEVLGEFVSYMSYEDIPVMFNVNNKLFCIKDNYINLMFTGDYGYFFGEYKPYDFTFVVNGMSLNVVSADKIFTNIDFRADRWSYGLDEVLSSEPPFDYIRVWNEYLDTGEVLLNDIKDRPSNLKKKFRTWRVNIPRDAHNRRDRIRNTWCKIKVGSAPRYRNGNDGIVELHDLNVTYYI